jgi:hypothetical protein
MKWMKKKLHKRALDEKETNGKKCIESTSTHNEAKTIFVPNFVQPPLYFPLPPLHFFGGCKGQRRTIHYFGSVF